MDSRQLALISNFETKIAVVEALDDLMKTTDISKITVGNICERARISRATFYRCFTNKLAVTQWFLDYVHSLGTDKIGRTLSWQKGYYITEEAIVENLDFFTNAAKASGYNAPDMYAPRKRKERLVETLVEVHGLELTERLKFQIDVVVEVETRLLPRWHYGEYGVSLDEITRWVADAVPRELFEILNTPPRKENR